MKKIKTALILIVCSLIIYLGSLVIFEIKKKNQLNSKIKSIPSFTFTTLEHKDFTRDNLRKNTNTIFIYFNSECDYCKDEAILISNRKNDLNNCQIIFVSSESIDKIEDFSTRYNLDNSESIVFLQDKEDVFYKKFNANSIPYILIYNTKGSLLKAHKGQLNFKYLENIIQ